MNRYTVIPADPEEESFTVDADDMWVDEGALHFDINAGEDTITTHIISKEDWRRAFAVKALIGCTPTSEHIKEIQEGAY